MTNILSFSAILVALLILGGFVHFRYWKSGLVRKLFSESKLIRLSCGDVEYATLGQGPVLFISHGGGTGHDNIFTYDYLVKEGFQLICPSKPGYLRTKVEVADTFEKQADMFAELLDKLGIKDKVGVLALSMGGPAALCQLPIKTYAAKIQFAVWGELGRHVNKVSTCVTIRHVPSGLSVTASDSRSQSLNRQVALERLLDIFEKQRAEKRQQKHAAASKARQQKARRSRGTKAKLVEGKRRRGETKKQRGRVST
jgi:hypothetical protein